VRFSRSERLHLALRLVTPHFSNRKACVILIGERTNTRDEGRNLRLRLIVDMQLKIKRPCPDSIARWRRRVIGQCAIVHRKVNGIDAEPINTPVQPEFCNSKQRILNVGIMTIELR
jgi:hypothetical protein